MVFAMESKTIKKQKINKRLLRSLILSAAFSWVGFAAASDSNYPLSKSIQPARLISSSHKDYASYDLIVGKIRYIEAADNEGFTPSAQKLLVGSIDRRLYDYPKRKSAIEIFENAIVSFQRQHYSIVYQCSGEDCGNAAGWRLFLSSKLGGDSAFQRYVAAVKERSSDETEYVAMYVNDLAGQPRAQIDVVNASRSFHRGADADKSMTGVTHSLSIYFDFGKYSLANDVAQIEKARKFVAENSESCPIRVIGYTDPIGGDIANRALAKARVDEVIKYISAVNDLSRDCLVGDPRGAETVVPESEFKNRRRVDIEVASTPYK